MKISGIVNRGKSEGGKIGFPTANIANKDIAPGIYAGNTTVHGVKYNSVIYVGAKRPDVVETHIFDFDKDIYGNQIEIEIVQKMRDDREFQNLDELKLQIAQDCIDAKEITKQTK